MPSDPDRLFYVSCARYQRALDLAFAAADPWRPARPRIQPDELAAYYAKGIEAIRSRTPPTADERRRYRAMMADLRRRLRKHQRTHR